MSSMFFLPVYCDVDVALHFEDIAAPKKHCPAGRAAVYPCTAAAAANIFFAG